MSRHRNPDDDEQTTTYGAIVVRDCASAHVGDTYHSHVVENLHVYLSAAEGIVNLKSRLPLRLPHATSLAERLQTSRDEPLLKPEASRAPQIVLNAAARLEHNERAFELKTALSFVVQHASELNIRPARLAALLQQVLVQITRASAKARTTLGPKSSLSSTRLSPAEYRMSSRQRAVMLTQARRDSEHDGQSRAMWDFLTYCAIFVTFFVYRTASSAELLATVAKLHALLLRIRDDKICTCLAALLTVFVYRLLQQASAQKSISEFSGDCVLFEDLFSNICSVPLCYFQGPYIFEGFLREHYQGSVAEYFIDHGLYNITFGAVMVQHSSTQTLLMVGASDRTSVLSWQCFGELSLYHVREGPVKWHDLQSSLVTRDHPRAPASDLSAERSVSFTEHVHQEANYPEGFSFGGLKNVDLSVEALRINNEEETANVDLSLGSDDESELYALDHDEVDQRNVDLLSAADRQEID
ncbi:hypothetical protein LTR70_000974 [Exophiala xenobiotica]|nr:hypothetical protein LTR70_000974 [Exophiala xenobiotica]